MGSKNHVLFQELTDDEQDSLLKLGQCVCGQKIPDAHGVKFLGLGLAELNCGGLSLTRTGRRVALGVVRH